MAKRTESKAQREMINYNRIKAMAGYMDMVDKRLESIADDLGLLVALSISDKKTKDKLVASIQDSMKELDAEAKND